MSKWGKRVLVICGSIVVMLAAVWLFNTGTFQETLYNGIRQREIYIYEKPFWKGGVTYLISHNEPEDIAERFPAEDYTHIGTYMATNAYAEIVGGIDRTFLIWDDEWFLWEMDTGEKTAVSIPYEPSVTEVQLLDSAEPEVAALGWRKEWSENQTGITAFFSILEDRLITDFAYGSYADDLQDGRIAAEDAEENWVLLDAVTGEVVGSLPGRP